MKRELPDDIKKELMQKYNLKEPMMRKLDQKSKSHVNANGIPDSIEQIDIPSAGVELGLPPFGTNMDKLNIEPNVGIGLVRLGMTENELEECFHEYESQPNKDLFTHFFNVEYDSNEKINFIEINNPLKEFFQCVYKDINLFEKKAAEVVKMIDEVSPYDRKHLGTDLGYSYFFPELGLGLWRGTVLHEEDLYTDWFKNMEPENQEDTIRNGMYLNTVSVKR